MTSDTGPILSDQVSTPRRTPARHTVHPSTTRSSISLSQYLSYSLMILGVMKINSSALLSSIRSRLNKHPNNGILYMAGVRSWDADSRLM